jgi:hypothetical protein
MSGPELALVGYRAARHQVRDGDLLLFRRRGLISIAGRGDHSHAAKAAWWERDFMFLEGFNSCMLEYDQPIWAVAVPITVRYEGDAEAGMNVRGYTFPPDSLAPASLEALGEPPTASSISTPIIAPGTLDAIENRT